MVSWDELRQCKGHLDLETLPACPKDRRNCDNRALPSLHGHVGVNQLDLRPPGDFGVILFSACPKVIVPLICSFLCLTLGVWLPSVFSVLDCEELSVG